MVSNCSVGPDKEPVVAVALKDIESALSYPIAFFLKKRVEWPNSRKFFH